MKIGSHDTHPLADTLPLMDDAALGGLVDDIRANGLRRPIILVPRSNAPDDVRDVDRTGLILDGRNRYRACEKADIAPRFRVYDGPMGQDDLARYVVSENLSRRDLTPEARTLAAQRLSRLVSKWCRDQLRLAHVDDDLAAKVVDDAEPDVQRAVETGDIALDVAARIAELEPDQQGAALDKAKELAAPKPKPKQAAPERLETACIELSPADFAALRAGYYALRASPHGECRAASELMRRIVPGVAR